MQVIHFKGEFTRFENPEDNMIGNHPPTDGGEIVGSKINSETIPPDGFDSFGDVNLVLPPPPINNPAPY